MDLIRREAAPEFVALDIRGEDESPGTSADYTTEPSFDGKPLERDWSGDANPSSAGVQEKHAVPVHVDGSPREQFQPSTPTTKRRRASRRVPGWRDPRKTLFAFAALSSVGTLILLYFTLSMGKVTDGQVDGQ